MGNRLVKIGKAAEMPGTTPEVLRQWEKTGELRPARRDRQTVHSLDVTERSLQNWRQRAIVMGPKPHY